MLKNIIKYNLEFELRLDKFLNDKIPNLSRTKIQELIKKDLVKVDDYSVKPSYKLKLDQIITFTIKNFKDEYHHGSHIIFRLFIEKNNLVELTPLTASLNASTPGVVVRNGQWKIVDATTNEEVIPYQDLDYDVNGNFFEVPMSNFETRRGYKIVFKLEYLGETKILDKNLFVFSVT